MGLKDARKKAIGCLKSGDYEHENRKSINEKNLLLTGEITIDDVCTLLNATKGNRYEESPHHAVPTIMVHEFKPNSKKVNGNISWYIKLYFIDDKTMMISAHPSE